MKARPWDAQTKAKVVLEGLRGRSELEICSEYSIHNSMVYEWWNKFLGTWAKSLKWTPSPKKPIFKLK